MPKMDVRSDRRGSLLECPRWPYLDLQVDGHGHVERGGCRSVLHTDGDREDEHRDEDGGRANPRKPRNPIERADRGDDSHNRSTDKDEDGRTCAVVTESIERRRCRQETRTSHKDEVQPISDKQNLPANRSPNYLSDVGQGVYFRMREFELAHDPVSPYCQLMRGLLLTSDEDTNHENDN